MNKRNLNITKIFTFDSAHHLMDYEGKCKNIHGHTYKLEVTLKGPVEKSGMVIDFHDMDRIVEDEVISYVDHKYLNDIFDFNPTCENIALWIWDKLDDFFKDMACSLEKVLLWETPTSFVTLEKKDMG